MRTWILQKWHGYARAVLLFGLVFNAIFFWRPTVDVFNLVKITSLWITGIVSLAIWVMWAAERGAWLPKMRLFWAAGAFLAAMLLATLFSQDPGLSLIGLYHRYGGFLPFALYAAIALTLVGLYWERPERLKEIPWAITLACVVMIPTAVSGIPAQTVIVPMRYARAVFASARRNARPVHPSTSGAAKPA